MEWSQIYILWGDAWERGGCMRRCLGSWTKKGNFLCQNPDLLYNLTNHESAGSPVVAAKNVTNLWDLLDLSIRAVKKIIKCQICQTKSLKNSEIWQVHLSLSELSKKFDRCPKLKPWRTPGVRSVKTDRILGRIPRRMSIWPLPCPDLSILTPVRSD